MPFTKVTDNLLSSGVGTGANNLVELDSSGALPAIDGANLTAIPVVTEAMIHPDAVNKFVSRRKNVIINGGFDVWQRGTSFSGVNSDYTTDRWFTQTDGTTTAQKVEDTVNGNKVATISSVASGQTYHVLLQRIENLRRYQGKTLTISAWVKSGVGTFTNRVAFRDSGGTSIDTPELYNITYTGSWQYITHTFTVPSNTLYDDLSFFNVSFYGGDALSISQVQLELGDQATDFEYRGYGEELALCQRYFIKVSGYGTSHIFPCRTVNTNTTSANTSAQYDIFRITGLSVMRTTPSLIHSNPTGITIRAQSGVLLATANAMPAVTKNGTGVAFITHNSANTITATQIRFNEPIQLDAEL